MLGPLRLLKMGDLLCLIDRMLQLRGLGTVKVSKVKGHADDGMVLDGRVRDLDRLGNNAADEAADFGRRRVPVHVIDARRNLVGVCNRWYPVVRHLHRFLLLLLGLLLIMMMAVVLRRTLLFGLLVLYPRGPGFFMLFVTLLFYLVLLVFGMGIGYLLVSVVSLLKMLGFGLILCLFLLRCRPFWALCIGRLVMLSLVLGVFHLLKCSFCMSSGLVNDFVLKVLFLGIGGLDVQFQCRLFLLVQALIFGAPVGFLGAIFRALRMLPGGLGRFLPGDIGANHGRLRHIGWEKCSHGLTSRPRETSSVWFFDELLILFGYPAASCAGITLRVSLVDPWRLPEVWQ